MHRSIRTLARLAVAVPVTATLIVAGAGGASAAIVDPGGTGITLDTSVSFVHYSSGDYLDVTAVGTFHSSFVENTTIALQVIGTETWTDADGNAQTQSIVQTPSSVEFASTNSVEVLYPLHPNAVVEVNYTAEDAGLAPTPFSGSCTGTGIQLAAGNTVTSKTC